MRKYKQSQRDLAGAVALPESTRPTISDLSLSRIENKAYFS